MIQGIEKTKSFEKTVVGNFAFLSQQSSLP